MARVPGLAAFLSSAIPASPAGTQHPCQSGRTQLPRQPHSS